MSSLSNPQPAVRPAKASTDGLPAWQRVLSEAIRDPADLCLTLGIEPPSNLQQATAGFGMLVPRGFVDRMRRGDPRDPLLLQVLPTGGEVEQDGLPTDAVGDLAALREPGLIHKYHGRALLALTGQCAVNCRYCFRRHFPYAELPRGDAAWEPALQAIESDPSIEEVILSGGDPLVLSDRRLSRVLTRLDTISHVATIRIHTRLPIVIPERATDALCRTLAAVKGRVVIVTHVNHANELDETVASAIGRLRDASDFLLNQSVLLNRVNDSVEALGALSKRLLTVGILPYYLHELDRVAGVGHFEAPSGSGERLIASLRATLPGYAVPRLVREEPGRPNKTVLA